MPAYAMPKAVRQIVTTYAAMPDTRRAKLIRRGRIVDGKAINPTPGQTMATAHLFPLSQRAVEKLWPGVEMRDIWQRIYLLVYRATMRDPKITDLQRVRAPRLPDREAAIDVEVQAAIAVAIIDAAGLGDELAADVRDWAMGPWLRATR